MGIEVDLSFLSEIFPKIDPAMWELIASILIFIALGVIIPALIAYLIFRLIGLTGFRRLFSYERRPSICHSMHPTAKIFFVLFVTISVAIVNSIIAIIILFLIAFIPWIFSNPSSDKMRLVLIFSAFQILLISYGQSFLNPGFARRELTALFVFPTPLYTTFHWEAITVNGLIYGMFQSLRVVAALSVAVWLITTTAPSDILYGLRRFFPLEINFMISTGIRAIPALLEKSTLVLAAERARGLQIFPRYSRNPLIIIRDAIRAFKVIITAFIPIIIESLRSGYQLALALSTKAFRAKRKRTYFRIIKPSWIDIAVMLLSIVGLLLIIFLAQLQLV